LATVNFFWLNKNSLRTVVEVNLKTHTKYIQKKCYAYFGLLIEASHPHTQIDLLKHKHTHAHTHTITHLGQGNDLSVCVCVRACACVHVRACVFICTLFDKTLGLSLKFAAHNQFYLVFTHTLVGGMIYAYVFL